MKTLNLAMALAAVALLAAASQAQEPLPMGDYPIMDGSYEDIGVQYEGDGGYYGNFYYHTSWGQPVAQLVPPTAGMHISYSRGVGGTTVNPIYSQYWGPTYGMEMQMMDGGAGMYRSTPYWPTSTSQFGVYYIRGPW